MIKEYKDGNETLFMVREFHRSSVDPSIRRERSMKGIKSLQQAKKISEKLKAETVRAVIQQEQTAWSWEKAIESWELAVRNGDIFTRDVTKGTLNDYVNLLHRYTADWMRIPVDQITTADAWKLLDQVESTVSISRRKRVRSVIDTVFNWGIRSRRFRKVTQLPTTGYKSLKRETEKTPEILNVQEVRSLLSYARTVEHPWYTIWAVALLTGMRSGELYALKWDKVDLENKQITVDYNWTSKNGFGPTKGRYWRTVPVNAQLGAILAELKLQKRGDFVLPRFQAWKDGRQAEVLRCFCTGSGMKSIKFHTLRSCFATLLLRDKVAPAVVMKICGWKDLKTMQRYIRLAGIEIEGATEGLKLISDREAMARVVDMFSGKD